jgi:hypothetical protein
MRQAGPDLLPVGADEALRLDDRVVDPDLEALADQLLDLNGRLGPDVEQLPGYEGIGW